ncbi:PCYCGC domain-containing protein [Paenibacillus camelliae]|uniref:PCYCGC domain-containing protein n=1 Tax=Paenibacillus camelliae TaxID=512410 RepID=UPI00203E6627|nr:PCYCGC domain-containing protein [Paenibacillus camelliae]MCM3635459.1 PCYCGC domain-containing protein [Paenibacillus camelliae]
MNDMNVDADQHEQQSSKHSSLMYLFLLGFAIITFLAACSLSEKESTHVHQVGSETWETTASAEELPQFLEQQTELTASLYGEVVDHAHHMHELPCYCGCMDGTDIDEPHDSLLRCYMVEQSDDGPITWTDHSTTCGICKQELQLVVEMADSGSSLEEIKLAIDEQFKH